MEATEKVRSGKEVGSLKEKVEGRAVASKKGCAL